MYLRCFVHNYPRQWLTYLPWAEFWYNTSYHSSTGFTPFKIVYGRDPPPVLHHTSPEDTHWDIHQQLAERDAVLADLKQNLSKAQQRMKFFADKKRTETEFQVDDWVLVRLQPYRQHSVQLRKFQKLALRYFGPFQVTERIGAVAYKLALPASAKIHPVFHVSQLKQFHGTQTSPSYLPFPLQSLPEGPLCTPVAILDSRWVHHQDKWVQQHQVQWDGTTHTTWENKTDLHRLYPHLNLEDKVISDGEGIVMSPNDQNPLKDLNTDPVETQQQGPWRKSLRIKKRTWKLRALEKAGGL